MKIKLYLLLSIVMIGLSCSKENEPTSAVYQPKNSKEVAMKNMAMDIVQIQEFSQKNSEIFRQHSAELKKMDVPTVINFLRANNAVDLDVYLAVLLRTGSDQKEFNYYNNLETNLALRNSNNRDFAEQVVKAQGKSSNQMSISNAAIDWCRITYALEIAAIIAVEAGTAGTATPAAMVAIALAAAQYTTCVIQRDF